jgi:Tol biopolymer transport system component
VSSGTKDLTAHRWPQLLPDGKHFLFTATKQNKGDVVAAGSLDSEETRTLVDGSSGGSYAGGHLFFLSNGLLMRQPFDTGRFELTGESRTVSSGESIDSNPNRALPYSISNDVLAYRSGSTSTASMLVWMDRRGEVHEAVDEPVEQDFAVGPDFRTLAVSKRAPGSGAADLWLLDLARGATSRMTFEARGAVSPLWSPDGQQILVVTDAGAEPEVRVVSVRQPGLSEVLWKSRGDTVLESWSPDGRSVLFTTTTDGRSAVWGLGLDKERKPVLFLTGNFNYKQARFSPDGRWVAYVSDESGRDEVYVRDSSHSSGEARAIVSIEGGTQPAWSLDGRELFYRSQGWMMAVPIEFTSTLRVGRARQLFKFERGVESFRVTPDGRFLVAAARNEDQRSPINVILHWSAER